MSGLSFLSALIVLASITFALADLRRDVVKELAAIREELARLRRMVP